MTAQDVIAAHRCMGPDLINAESGWVGACTCGWRGTAPVRTRVDWEREHAGHQVDALAAAGYAVVRSDWAAGQRVTTGRGRTATSPAYVGVIDEIIPTYRIALDGGGTETRGSDGITAAHAEAGEGRG
ncbi:hypothetical protein nbrc107696_45870 [Gordonia spumicola]|uniref:Uncharacterized protein n=1 Tax=Gordonia spumicola TaxID=589161 RepID=A0A7I9VGB2_9ACTN|nr:hypothetical protein [Gordonia spumicola]GEE00212.1 hypothetical protein nbrc107696_06580 [Gordonia spumicola]GEE04141.1 hypothetical protein nbrc107696_45870 [Gordonia spumicola]